MVCFVLAARFLLVTCLVVGVSASRVHLLQRYKNHPDGELSFSHWYSTFLLTDPVLPAVVVSS